MEPSKIIAENIKSLRVKRDLSQENLARLATIPRSTIANLESGFANPSLMTLISISSAFRVSIEELLSRQRDIIERVPADKIPIQRRKSGIEIYKLLPEKVAGMEMERVILAPQTRMVGVPHVKGTREYLVCLKNEVRLAVAGESLTAYEGDVLAFPGDNAHSYFNPGKKESEFFSVVIIKPV